MCELGLHPDSFNPRILYVLEKKFNSDCKISYHSHDFVSLIFIQSGSCCYNIDNVVYQVKKGDMIILNSGVMHSKVISPGEEVNEFHIGFNNFMFKNFPENHILPEDIIPIIRASRYEEDFLKCCTEIMAEQSSSQPGTVLMLKSLVMKLIVLLIKAIYANDIPKESAVFNFEIYDKTNIVNTIVSYINDNYMKNISLDKISRNMYLSSVYISKIFKDETGESPINYLIKTRLSKARYLLEEGQLSIKAVAESVGYHDAYHFSKLFKKYYSFPPSRFKGTA